MFGLTKPSKPSQKTTQVESSSADILKMSLARELYGEKNRLEKIAMDAHDAVERKIYQAQYDLKATREEQNALAQAKKQEIIGKEKQAQEILAQNGITDIVCVSSDRPEFIYRDNLDSCRSSMMSALYPEYSMYAGFNLNPKEIERKPKKLSDDEILAERENVPLVRIPELKRLKEESSKLWARRRDIYREIAIADEITPELRKKVVDFSDEMANYNVNAK